MRHLAQRARGGGARVSMWAVALVALACLLAGCASSTGWQALVGSADEPILSLAVYATNTNIILAGSSNGTLYRANGASTGQPTNTSTGLPKNTPINVLIPDPDAHDQFYAATDHGLYISRDVGNTWSARGTGFPTNDAMDALTFGANAQTLFAGSEQHGVYLSHDAGATWSPASAGLPNAQVYTLLYDASTSTLYAGLVGQGIYASTDGAATWAARGTGLTAGDDVFMFLRLADHGLGGSGPTLYAATAKGLYASTNGGQQWQAAGTGIAAGRVLSLAADPTAAGTLYAGTDITVYRSTDGGQNWSQYASGIDHQVAAIAVTPGRNHVSEVFAAAGALYRFPRQQSGASPLATIIPIVLLAIILGYLFWRQRRSKREFTARREARMRNDQPPGGASPGDGGMAGGADAPPSKWDSLSR